MFEIDNRSGKIEALEPVICVFKNEVPIFEGNLVGNISESKYNKTIKKNFENFKDKE